MNEEISFLIKVREYAMKLIKAMEYGTCTLEQLCDNVYDNVEILSNINKIIPYEIYVNYEEFFEEFSNICKLCKNPEFFDGNAELILKSYDLYLECMDIIVREYNDMIMYDTTVSEELLEHGPLVSVIMSCYNHEEFVADTIESVINQTYKNIEFLVADDASTDNSVDVMKRYSKYYVVEDYYKDNYGSRIWDLFDKTTGKYVAMINSDDVWECDKIAMQVQYLEEHEDVLACFTWCEYVDERLNVVASNNFKVKNRSRYEWMKEFWEKGNCLCYPSILIRREAYVKLFENKKPLRQLADFFQWVDLVQLGDIFIIPRVQTKMRRYSNSKVSNMSAMSVENLTRDTMEKMVTWSCEIEEMEPEYFVKVFQDELINKNASTKAQIMCEKFFLMYNDPRLVIQSNAFYYFVKIYRDEEVRRCLEEEYRFSFKEVYKTIVEKGFGKYIAALTENVIKS